MKLIIDHCLIFAFSCVLKLLLACKLTLDSEARIVSQTWTFALSNHPLFQLTFCTFSISVNSIRTTVLSSSFRLHCNFLLFFFLGMFHFERRSRWGWRGYWSRRYFERWRNWQHPRSWRWWRWKVRIFIYTILKVKFLSKNSILTTPPTFSRVFHPIFFFDDFFRYVNIFEC